MSTRPSGLHSGASRWMCVQRSYISLMSSISQRDKPGCSTRPNTINSLMIRAILSILGIEQSHNHEINGRAIPKGDLTPNLAVWKDIQPLWLLMGPRSLWGNPSCNQPYIDDTQLTVILNHYCHFCIAHEASRQPTPKAPHICFSIDTDKCVSFKKHLWAENITKLLWKSRSPV